MNIIAHRGWWQKQEEKNTYIAFERALENGYGIETDIRDYCGNLVISHNIADKNSMLCEDFFELCKQKGYNTQLALNIKSDGIQDLLTYFLSNYNISNYYVFDMSVPEMVVYKQRKINYFTRQSDIEKSCVMYTSADGVWIDSFFEDWDFLKCVEYHIENGKKVTIVSPELHSNSYSDLWNKIKQKNLHIKKNLSICTDLPKEAEDFFGGY